MSVIDEVKQKIDIVDVASQYTKLTKAGRNFKGLCPLHSEKNPSFFVYPDQQSWHCFGSCNTGGDVFSLVMKKQGIDFGEALRLLAQKAGVSLPARGEAEGGKKPKLYQVNQAAAEYFHNLLISSPAGEKARNYVARRGLSLKTLSDFQLGFSPNSWEALKQHLVETGYTEDELLEAGLIVESEDKKRHDRFRNRLMFPIHDSQGRTIGFGARALDDAMPKYLNSPQTPLFDKSSVLYGLDLAMPAIRQQNTAVIVEGYMDVITTHQHGFSNVVATMGTAVTERQISALRKQNLILALDADTAGEEAMLRCVGYENILGSEIRATIMPQGRDPDDVIKEDPQNWPKLLEEALPVVDFTFNQALAGLDLTTAKDVSLAAERLFPVIDEIKDDTRQAHYLQKLATKLDVSFSTLERSFAAFRVKKRRATKTGATESVFPREHTSLSNPREEYCLALLLQHPQLKEQSRELRPEYFANTANQEVFLAYQRAKGVELIREELDSTFHEYIDYLLKKPVLPNQIEQKLTQCVLQLKIEFLQSLEAKNKEALDLAREQGGSAAELAKLKEQGTKIGDELKEVFYQQRQPRPGAREVRDGIGKQR